MVTWNISQKGNSVTLSDGNLKAIGINQLSSVKSSVVKTDGSWFCEIKVIKSNNTSIGIGSSSLPMTSSITSSTDFYYYYSNGNKLNSGIQLPYGTPFIDGDVIGVLVNFDKGELSFYKNGVGQGVAFNNIKKLADFCIIVSSGTQSAPTEVLANFGTTSFQYTPNKSSIPLNTKSLDESQYVSYISKNLISNNNEYKKWNERIPYKEINTKLNPVMTSDTTPAPYKTLASSVQGIYNSWKAFNGISNSAGDMWGATYTQVKNQWIQMFLGEAKICNKIVIYPVSSTTAPRNFDILGSNNGTDFTLIKEYKDESGWTAIAPREFKFDNNESYSYYRLFIHDNNGSNDYISLVELELYHYDIINYNPQHWSIISSTTPTLQQFKTDGMSNLSSLSRKVATLEPVTMIDKSELLNGETGKIKSAKINLDKYFDIRSIRTDVK